MNGSYLKLVELGNRHRRMGRNNHLAALGLGFLSQPPKKPPESMRLKPCLDFVYYENGPTSVTPMPTAASTSLRVPAPFSSTGVVPSKRASGMPSFERWTSARADRLSASSKTPSSFKSSSRHRSDRSIRAEPFMLFKRLRALTAAALISFSSANNRRRPEPLAQVNDESDAPKIALTPSKDLSPAPMRLALPPLYTSHTGSRSSATVRRIAMQG